MIRYVPSFISERIRRDDIPADEVSEHPREKAEKELREQQEEVLRQIRSACASFRATCPGEWAVFEENLMMIHGIAYTLDRRTPFDLLGAQRQAGVPIDPMYWSLNKAFLAGQLELLDAMFASIGLKPPNEIKLPKKQAPKKISIFSLQFWKRLVGCTPSSN